MYNAKFVNNVWNLIVDPKTDDMIRWSKDGRKIIIINQERFAREILPLHFKHRNMSSFVRQLHLYSFTKKHHGGQFDFDRDEIQFYHPFFRRNCAHLLEKIKKKPSSDVNRAQSVKNSKGESYALDLEDLKFMRDSFESKISDLEEGNEARQRELHSLRKKCAKHEEILEKLLYFSGFQNSPEQTKPNKADEANGNESVSRDPLSPCESPRPVKSSHSDNDDPVLTQDPVPTECPNPQAISLSYTFDFSNAVLNPIAGTTSTSTVINAVNSDGSHIVYSVTEVPESVTPTPKTATNDIEVLKSESRQNKRKGDATTSKLTVAKFARTYVNSKQKKITPELETNGPSSSVTKTNCMDLTTIIDPTVIPPETEESKKKIVIDPLDLLASDMPVELFEEAPIIIEDSDLVSKVT